MSSEKKPQPVERFYLRHLDGGTAMDRNPNGYWIRYSDHEATIEALRAERDEAWDRAREARKLISATHKNAVEHTNCDKHHCMICDGGLFVCADCGAAEIETEQQVCPGAEARVAQLEAALEPFAEACDDCIDDDDVDRVSIWEHPAAMNIAIGNLRRARALLSDGGRG